MKALLNNSPLITDIPAMTLRDLPGALRDFSLRPFDYRQQYTQVHYGVAFDGYSYPGQADSLNQGSEDQLHSFVFSDFFPADRYPAEFQRYLAEDWPTVSRTVQELEQALLIELGLKSIARQQQNFSHMMSANYFPPPNGTTGGADGLRLTEHPDVSLLTVFPFGMGGDFQYQDDNGEWIDAGPCDRVVIFAGDLLQWMTDGNIRALNHRVKRSHGDQGERFSFALFSLPTPREILLSDSGASITGKDWYRLHLSQWD